MHEITSIMKAKHTGIGAKNLGPDAPSSVIRFAKKRNERISHWTLTVREGSPGQTRA